MAAGCKIQGEIKGNSNLVVEGEVQGTVTIDSSVTVASGGRIRGNVTAATVTIGGRVQGNVKGDDKVEILASGRLEGDVSARRVVLAEGAFFKGNVEMTGNQGAKEKAKGAAK